MAVKVFTIAYKDILPLGPSGAGDVFTINLPGRRITLKKIIITRNIYNLTTPGYIPNEQNTTQLLEVSVGVAGAIFTNAPAAGVGLAVIDRRGSFINLYEPGEYNFNWSDFQNALDISYLCGNLSGAFGVEVKTNFYIEVEDRIIYYN